MICPKCGKEMDEGFLHGGWCRLWWDKEPTRYTWMGGGETLNYGTFTLPTLKACRCQQCRLVLAKY